MRDMKYSGIEGIGNIPCEFKVSRIKYLADMFGRIGFRGYTEQDLVDEDGGAIALSPSNINNMRMTYDKCSYISWFKFYESPEIMIHNGDVIMVKTGSTYGKSCFVDGLHKEATINPQLLVFKNININSKFFSYFLQTDYFSYLCELAVAGSAIPTMSQAKIGNFSIFVPPLREQEKIAAYLDRKCSEIDALMTDIQSEIETLEEYKRSVITEAVTKGLDSDVEMKDSGVEWIGDIPQEWEINRIKYMFSNGKGLPITKENLIDEGLSVISYGQIHAKFNTGVDILNDLIRFVSFNYERLFPQCEVFQYDFVFADTSEDYDGCGNCVYKRDDSLLYAGYHTIILHSLKRNDNRYFAYLFQTDIWRKQIRCAVSGVKVFSITQKIIMNSQVIVPPLREQQQIANYLDRKCSEIDGIIQTKKQQLETLAEYKKSLIYEYVTGKKEVV